MSIHPSSFLQMASVATPCMSSSSSFSPRFSSSSSSSLSPPPRFRVICQSQFSSKDLKFVLHDVLDSSGQSSVHSRAARDGFSDQIQRLSSIERETSICVNRRVDLAKTALYIAAEDDSLLSHSSVPLPVDAFIERTDSLSTSYFPHHRHVAKSSVEDFLASVEKYLFVRKGFRRTTAGLQSEPRSLYLHSVLTHRYGSPVILSLILSEVLKHLRFWGLYEFDAEIFHPRDPHALPRGYDKQRSKESDHAHILTTESLLVEMLRELKEAYWPFQHDRSKSLFLRAADAASFADRSNAAKESAFEIAYAKAAQHRLDRGVWTSIRFGDMKCALSACERLILLETDINELRDYGVLLYHCGLFEESLHYLKLFQELKAEFRKVGILQGLSSTSLELGLSTASTSLSFRTWQQKSSSSKEEPSPKGDAEPSATAKLEDDAVEKLIVRLNLILMEEGWGRPSQARNFLSNNSEPW